MKTLREEAQEKNEKEDKEYRIKCIAMW